MKGRVQEFPGTRSRVPWNVVATCMYSVRPGGARAAKYALAAAIGAVDARFTARGPAPPAIVCAVAAAGVDLQSASATTVLKLLVTVDSGQRRLLQRFSKSARFAFVCYF